MLNLLNFLLGSPLFFSLKTIFIHPVVSDSAGRLLLTKHMKYLLTNHDTNIKYTEKYIYKVNCAYTATTKSFVPNSGHYWNPLESNTKSYGVVLGCSSGRVRKYILYTPSERQAPPLFQAYNTGRGIQSAG